MKKSFIYVLAILLPLCTFSQNKSWLTVGDTMHFMELQHVVNAPVTSLLPSALKDKLVVLDFFGTSCGACVNALPHLDSLQKKFSGDLVILVVTNQKATTIRNFLDEGRFVKNVYLPFVTEDKILEKLFPHTFYPHEVWIGGDGIVRAITTPRQLNEENISAILKGKHPDLPLKQDQLDYNFRRPLFENGNGGDIKQVTCQTTLSGYLPGGGEYYRSPSGDDFRTACVNMSLVDLYMHVLHFKFPLNRFVLEVKDSSKMMPSPGLREREREWQEWQKHNFYCFEITVGPGTSKEREQELALASLNTGLYLNARAEPRDVTCYALVRTDTTNHLWQTRYNKIDVKLMPPAKQFYLHNASVSTFISALNGSREWRPIVIDETGYTGKIDLDLGEGDFHDFSYLNKQIQPFGLSIVPVQRKLNMFVITELAHN